MADLIIIVVVVIGLIIIILGVVLFIIGNVVVVMEIKCPQSLEAVGDAGGGG